MSLNLLQLDRRRQQRPKLQLSQTLCFALKSFSRLRSCRSRCWPPASEHFKDVILTQFTATAQGGGRAAGEEAQQRLPIPGTHKLQEPPWPMQATAALSIQHTSSSKNQLKRQGFLWGPLRRRAVDDHGLAGSLRNNTTPHRTEQNPFFYF